MQDLVLSVSLSPNNSLTTPIAKIPATIAIQYGNSTGRLKAISIPVTTADSPNSNPFP